MTNLGNFDELLDAHLKMQMGCYFSRVEDGPADMRYVWSELIPDLAWNFAVSHKFCDFRMIDWVSHTALERKRTPSLLVPEEESGDKLSSDPRFKEALPERWMVFEANQTVQSIPDIPYFSVTTRNMSRPDDDFLKLFANLFDRSDLNDHFSKHYVPALAAARNIAGVSNRHFVGYLHDKPVCCASIYFCGHYAGLYNVGTSHAEQKRGFGRAISLYSLRKAVDLGCRTIFLQCEVGTHVESLYRSIGFSIVNTPRAFVFNA